MCRHPERRHSDRGERSARPCLGQQGRILRESLREFVLADPCSASVEVWMLRGLRRFLVLFALRLETRKVEIHWIMWIMHKITEEFGANSARNLVDPARSR